MRRIYGDFTTQQMSSWKQALNEFAVQPHQQFAYTTGKNATDSALIIDAMDLLHSGTLGGFCIVSSDSDFTRLATRIREQGVFVMGIGQPQTPKSFVNACDVFVQTTNLVPGLAPATDRDSRDEVVDGDWSLVIRAAADAAQDDGWAQLSGVGTLLRNLDPAFDPRTFGHKRLRTLVESRQDLFDVRVSSDQGPAVIDIRLRSPQTRA